MVCVDFSQLEQLMYLLYLLLLQNLILIHLILREQVLLRMLFSPLLLVWTDLSQSVFFFKILNLGDLPNHLLWKDKLKFKSIKYTNLCKSHSQSHEINENCSLPIIHHNLADFEYWKKNSIALIISTCLHYLLKAHSLVCLQWDMTVSGVW